MPVFGKNLKKQDGDTVFTTRILACLAILTQTELAMARAVTRLCQRGITNIIVENAEKEQEGYFLLTITHIDVYCQTGKIV